MAGEVTPTPTGSLYAPLFHFGERPRPLHELADWDNGLAFKDIHFTPAGLPVVKIAEVKGGLGPETKRTLGKYEEAVHLRNGDLLFCWSGQPESSIGTYRWFGGDAWLNQHIFKVTPKEGVTFEYLHALLRFLQPNFVEIARNKQTTGLGHVTKADLRAMMVEIPTVGEQRKITELVTPLDDKIQLNRYTAETLEAIARALFKSWFVDFDPVRAKTEGRPTGLPNELDCLFPDDLDENGVPMGWEITSFEALVEINPSGKLQVGTAAPYVDMAALPTRSARIESWIERPASSGARFQNDDTLVARITPCLENGKTALVDFLPDEGIGWGSTEFIVLRPRTRVPAAFPYLVARHEPFRSYLIGTMTGTSGRQRVPPSAAAAWAMARPDPKVLAAFGRIVEPIFQRLRVADAERQTLATLRGTLLPKLISGELRIADAEKRISAA